MAVTFVSRYGTMANEVGITRTFEYFLNEQIEEDDCRPLTYSERRNLVIGFIGNLYAVRDTQVSISKETFHLKGVGMISDKPLWQCCITFRDTAQE